MVDIYSDASEIIDATRNGDLLRSALISRVGLCIKEHSSTSWWRAKKMSKERLSRAGSGQVTPLIDSEIRTE